MTTVGFIGLGVMGKPMARQVLAAGHEVIVHNRSPQAVDELVSEGATAASGPADLASRCDTVITVLPSDTEVLEVILGDGGVLEGLAAGSAIVDMSTTKPQTATAVGQRCEAAGIGFLDAPVSGGEVGAIAGTLPSAPSWRRWAAASSTWAPTAPASLSRPPTRSSSG